MIAGLKNNRPEGGTGATGKPSISAKERRRIEAEKRRLAKEARRGAELKVAELEQAILELEAEQEALSKQLEDPASYADAAQARDLNLRLGRIAKRLEEKNYEWELAAEELSELVAEQLA